MASVGALNVYINDSTINMAFTEVKKPLRSKKKRAA